jgi:hypothetical protein
MAVKKYPGINDEFAKFLWERVRRIAGMGKLRKQNANGENRLNLVNGSPYARYCKAVEFFSDIGGTDLANHYFPEISFLWF